MYSIIVAIDEKNGIGKENTIPWYLPEDLKYFREKTIGKGNNVVIMGRNTWESIPTKFRPLKDRHNIIISKSYSTYHDLDDALNYVKLMENIDEIFIIGGEMLYKEAIKRKECNKLYITRIKGDYNCDKFFPDFHNYNLIEKSSEYTSQNNIKYHFETYFTLPSPL